MRFRLIHADVLKALHALPAASVQCAVTSPPYWGLRDYGLPPSIWLPADMGDCPEPICIDGHSWGDGIRHKGGAGGQGATSQRAGRANVDAQQKQRDGGNFCDQCGAWRGCLGLEPTPELFVEHVVAVFRELRRVLRDDGTLWLNMGDSYNSGSSGGLGGSTIQGGQKNQARSNRSGRGYVDGLKPKDLIGIPWMVAFALRADGWYLRADIVWNKPNPMPESVTDRPTKAHEYLFLLAKSAKYFYDADAIAEPAISAGDVKRTNGSDGMSFNSDCNRTLEGFRRGVVVKETRNKRSVWTIATKPFPGAHFATFPSALVEPCILAGSKAGDVILDPFNGSGTVGMVALGLNRNYIGVELNPEYVAMSRRRLEGVSPLFTEEISREDSTNA